MSLPDPPVSVLADDDPVIEMPEESTDASTFWKFVTVVEVADGLIGIAEVDVRRARQHQRIGAAPPSIETSVP